MFKQLYEWLRVPRKEGEMFFYNGRERCPLSVIGEVLMYDPYISQWFIPLDGPDFSIQEMAKPRMFRGDRLYSFNGNGVIISPEGRARGIVLGTYGWCERVWIEGKYRLFLTDDHICKGPGIQMNMN